MNKLLVQWVLIISSIILVTGCTSGGDLPAEEEPNPFFEPVPGGVPVFSEINEPYIGPSSNNNEALSLFSYNISDVASEASTETEIFSTESGVFLSLNTVNDALGAIEYSAFARNDSVFLINHLTNEIRQIAHFVNKVCELIPVEVVSERLVNSGAERQLTILHDELIYVVTAESSSAPNDCLSDSKKRFYALPLDRQLDPSLEPNGELESLELVNEATARAKLIFGWVPDLSNASQDMLAFGYLGFSVEQEELNLFDGNRDLVWRQERQLQRFEQVMIGPETLSDKYIFHIKELENQQYLIQLGLDVFVVDSGKELLTKSPSDVDTILNDKILSMQPRRVADDTDDARYYALPVETHVDSDDLLLIDHDKLYRLSYQEGVAPRNPAITNTVVSDVYQVLESKEYLTKQTFSQFDLKSCANDPDNLIPCQDAHDVEAQTWQFLTPCEAQFGCVEPQVSEDLCLTREEQLQTQATEPELCTPSDYRHLAELNNVDNDAQLLAYMQYLDEFSRGVEFALESNRLFITARMNEKDVFLAYDYNQDFGAPKSLREQVIFGARAKIAGVDAYFSNDNLYLTALTEGAVRVNECYKDGARVACELNDFSDGGGAVSCTGKDFAEKLCTNQFTEYESKALFCSTNQLADFSCSDAANPTLNNFALETAQEDAKWLPIYDYRLGAQEMVLMTGNSQAALESGNLDEGKVYLPELFRVDQTNGQKIELLGRLEGSVESVVGGEFLKEPSLAQAEVIGRLSIISDDISQQDSQVGQLRSKVSNFLLEQSFATSSSTVPDEIKAPKLSEWIFARP